MPWFYNSHSGELTEQDGISALPYFALLHTGIGWHELNLPGTASFSDAAAEAQKEVPGGASPTSNPVTAAGQVVPNVAGAAASSISASILGPLFQSNIWLRIGEVIAGLILLGIGLNALLGGRPLQIVTAPAGALGKAVP